MGNVFNPDFQDFIKALNEAEVKYILVGGYAVILHGYNRSTGDMDIWVERSAENYQKVVKAFLIFGMPVFDMTLTNFIQNDLLDVFTFGRPPVSIDIMLEVKGLTFDAAFQNTSIRNIDGIEVRLLGMDSLVKAKLAAGRFKDLDDLENLQAE
jgi:hypothetical protein